MKYICTFGIFFLFYSCANNRLYRDVEQLMQQQITLPLNIGVVLKGKDTVLNSFTEVPIKLVIWYDSLVCASCQVGKMYEWNDITKYANSLATCFNIVYLFTPKKRDLNRVNIALKIERFDYPVFVDQDGSFVKQNPKLPKNKQLHAFLLDKNNKVVMVGNPLYSPALWRLYINTIQKMIANNGVLPDN